MSKRIDHETEQKANNARLDTWAKKHNVKCTCNAAGGAHSSVCPVFKKYYGKGWRPPWEGPRENLLTASQVVDRLLEVYDYNDPERAGGPKDMWRQGGYKSIPITKMKFTAKRPGEVDVPADKLPEKTTPATPANTAFNPEEKESAIQRALFIIKDKLLKDKFHGSKADFDIFWENNEHKFLELMRNDPDVIEKMGLGAPQKAQRNKQPKSRFDWKPPRTESLARRMIEDLMPGGLADKVPVGDLDPKELLMGMKDEEEEHGPAAPAEIAADHLVKDPSYYTHQAGKETPKAKASFWPTM